MCAELERVSLLSCQLSVGARGSRVLLANFLSHHGVAEWIKWSGKLPGEEIRGVERSRLRIVKLGLWREKAHGDTIERPNG